MYLRCSRDEEPLISVLAEAASNRYYRMFNLRPLLSLAKDGAILSDDEPISFVLSNNEEVSNLHVVNQMCL